jgi:hypothetical protein
MERISSYLDNFARVSGSSAISSDLAMPFFVGVLVPTRRYPFDCRDFVQIANARPSVARPREDPPFTRRS